MITKNMIDAGLEVYENIDGTIYPEPLVIAIYEAMSDQKQKDALIAYNEGDRVYGHSSR